jgi:transcriptional regulator with XRE-family HTH domain
MLNQEDFAKRINLSGNAISMIERGENSLKEQNIRLICITFGVNEKWLRGGEGEMFSAETPSAGAKEVLDTYRELYPENQKFVLSMIKQLLETQRCLLGTKSSQSPQTDG